MGLSDTIATRRAYRDALREAIVETAIPSFSEIEGGPNDGVGVLTRRAFDEAIDAVFSISPPPTSAHVAEVATPGTVIVSATCPRCGIPSEVALTVHPELVVDEEGAEIRVKTKSKARAHDCDQLPVPLFDEPQIGFDLPIGPVISSGDLLALLETVRDEFAEEDFPTILEIDTWREGYRAKVKAWAIAVRDDPTFDDDFPDPAAEPGEPTSEDQPDQGEETEA